MMQDVAIPKAAIGSPLPVGHLVSGLPFQSPLLDIPPLFDAVHSDFYLNHRTAPRAQPKYRLGADIAAELTCRPLARDARFTVRNKEEIGLALRAMCKEPIHSTDLVAAYIERNEGAVEELVNAGLRYAMKESVKWIRRIRDGSPYVTSS